ncbi:ATP-binding protein [Chloroflexus aggregans]|uniref:Helicase HerA central domain-containing protein n=1 Tax=Chloroflexus aggregans (strain MD-66 / DSM 9485) TaxID=326427 RepID=B8G745_CHLAD|nr:DUF87 domain-containing protein [Chloroflexus aggregans]ACL24002.1 hypothetical protein Cagg_1089 [Chloroflexus aggregans DSM 9485]
MHLREPYIFTINDSVGAKGVHAIFAARVPFIPSFMTSDFTRSLSGGGKSRLELITERQVRFINDLLNTRNIGVANEKNSANITIDLRYIARPNADKKRFSSNIDVVFLGKAFHEDEATAKRLCHQLWRKFIAHFPFEDPFNYPLEAVSLGGDSREDIDRCMETMRGLVYPIPFNQLDCSNNPLLEIRKYEDFDPELSPGAIEGYFPHRFMPTFDTSALGRFLETLVQQQQLCVASICLRPTQLTRDEEIFLMDLLAKNETYITKLTGRKKLHFEERFQDVRDTFWPIINRRYHLFQIKIQVLGEKYPPTDVLEALGSELLGNTYKQEPRLWAKEQPATINELKVALYNFECLEYKSWGKRILSDSRAIRLRQLVTPTEAAGAFRLPIPPESGYLPGIIVRDEPFVIPQSTASSSVESISLGEIFHHGQATGENFFVPVRDLAKHVLIAGATGSGKTNTCLHLLSQLYADYKVPFLVMYPIDKSDYRLLIGDPAIKDSLLIYTVGDETTSPFRFNPFYVADKILLKTHISLLMRCFSAAFSMWDPLPAVYRAALRQVYRANGWDLDHDTGETGRMRQAKTPCMSQFYEVLLSVTEQMTAGYDEEAKGRVRQSAEIRLHDLLLNAGTVVNTEQPAPIADILRYPTVMELGRVGSTQDTALIMGFLIVLLIEEIQSNYRKISTEERQKPLRHVLLIEEAHRLMSAVQNASEDLANPQAKGGEDFANILAEVRGFGQGIFIAEQIPTQLVNGALGNTNLKIMHRLEDQDSFKLFCEILNLNERQKEYVRSLEPGQVIVRGRDSRPVFVKVGNYLDRFQTSDDYPLVDDSDEAVKKLMSRANLSVRIPTAMQWYPENAISTSTSADILLTDDSQPFLETVQQAVESENWERVRRVISGWLNPANSQKIKVKLCEEIVRKLNYTGTQAEIILSLFK